MKDDPILITGATGFLGGFLAGELIKRGRRTLLITGPRGDADERISRLLSYLQVEPLYYPEVLRADLTKPDLGLDRDGLSRLGRIEEALHCAAVTSFAEARSDLVRSVNLQGTVNLLNALRECGRFHHMSTAYAAGKTPGRCMESPIEADEFNNPYEETKKIAEDTVFRLCEKKGIDLTVFRPSITYGDSLTGRTIRFNALYYPVRVLLFLRDTMKRDILQSGGKRASSLGVAMDNQGRVRLPVTLPGSGSLNLIPIDFLVRTVLGVMDKGGTGIFHVVNPRGSSVEELISYIETSYGVTGVTAAAQTGEKGVLQRLIDRYIKVYYPYLSDERRFDRTRLENLLGSESSCPAMNGEIFTRCIDYALETDWGRSLPLGSGNAEATGPPFAH